LAFSVVALIRLVGAAVALDLYLRFRAGRYLLLLTGWLVYGLSAFVALVWRDSAAAQFVYPFAATLGLYLFLEVVLAFFDKSDRRRLVIVPLALFVLFLLLRQVVGEGYGVAAPAIQTLLLVGSGAIAIANRRRLHEAMGSSLYWLVAIFVIGALHAVGYVSVYRQSAEMSVAPMAVTALLGVVGVVFFIHLEHGVVLRRQISVVERMSSFMAGLDAVILESDLDAIYRVAGQTERILGYSVDDWFAHEGGAIGFWRDHLHPDDRAGTIAESDRNTMAGLDHVLEYRMLAPGGRVVWIRDHVTVETLPGGAALERSVLVDVSQQKLAEVELARSESRLRALVDSSVDHIFILDRTGRYRDTNQRLAHVGLDEDDLLVGRTLEDVYPPALAHEYRAAFDRVIKTGEPVSFDHVLGDPPEEQFHQDTLYPVLQDGAIWAVGGICHDVTDRRRLEQDLFRSQKMDAIGRLAGGVAHDFNNYLTAILGYSEFLASSFEPDDPRLLDVDEIQATSERAAALTRQLLAFGRRQMTQPALLDLGALVAAMEQMLRRLMRENVALSIRADDDLWSVKADPAHIEQVLVNLVVNAAEAMPDGGNITVAVENTQIGGADLPGLGSDARTGKFVRLSVVDTGVGMDADTLSHVFEPFFTRRAEERGTGLGLATVHGIVAQAGGFTSIDSKVGIGTIFDVYIPRAFGAIKGTTTDRGRARPAGGTETILVAEDHPQVRALVIRFLAAAGYSVLEAGTGEEAIRLADRSTETVDLLLSDLVMPGTTGLELMKRVLEAHPAAGVVFMSGYTPDEKLRAQIEEGGAFAFLAKPFSPEELLDMVRARLDSRPGAG